MIVQSVKIHEISLQRSTPKHQAEEMTHKKDYKGTVLETVGNSRVMEDKGKENSRSHEG